MPPSKDDLSARLKETSDLIKALNEKKKLLYDQKTHRPLNVVVWNALFSSKSKVGKYLMGFGDAESKEKMQSWALGTVREINNYLNTVHKKETRPGNSKMLKDAMSVLGKVLVDLRKSLVAFARTSAAMEDGEDIKFADHEKNLLRSVTLLAASGLVVREYEALDKFLTILRDDVGKLKAKAEEASLEKKHWLATRRDILQRIEDLEEKSKDGSRSETERKKAVEEMRGLQKGVEKGDKFAKKSDSELTRIRKDQKVFAEEYKKRMGEFDSEVKRLRREATRPHSRPSPEARKLLDKAKKDPKKANENQKKVSREVQGQLKDLPRRCTVLSTTINQSLEAISRFLKEAAEEV